MIASYLYIGRLVQLKYSYTEMKKNAFALFKSCLFKGCTMLCAGNVFENRKVI